ncbi:redox-sensing transcriptional repressor Rex [bacterium]|nr:redox-sensing transcriptional repressor Rex [bacterium]
MSSPRKVSESTIRRLSFYTRTLRELSAEGQETASSDRLARATGITAAQVRKDLTAFGSFGVRGRGYAVEPLRAELLRILGLDRTWQTVVVGAGRLGGALAASPDLARQGFRILALFDVDPDKFGQTLGQAAVRPLDELPAFVAREAVDIGIITTPKEHAQAAADHLSRAGVHGILNFASARLETPPSVHLRNVNLAIELEGLSFAIADKRGAGGHGG